MIYHLTRNTIILALLLTMLLLSAISVIGVAIIVKKPDIAINLIEQLRPPVTPAPFAIHGIAVIGDSQSDEYRANENRGHTYASTTLNWVEILAKKRDLNFGKWGTWDEPRRIGYEYNWARNGATVLSMLESGQPQGVAEQVRQNKINLVIIFIGANDFAPTITDDDYTAFYNNSLSQTETLDKINLLSARIKTTIETIQKAGNAKILLIKVPDWSNNVSIQIAYPFPHQRARVSEAIRVTNEELETLASRYHIATLDPNIFYQQIMQSTSGTQLEVSGKTIYRLPPSDEPNHLFLSDGIHPGTVLNGLFANAIIQTLNRQLGTTIKPLSEKEILETAGLL